MISNRREYRRYPLTVGLTVRMNGVLAEGSACADIGLGGMCILFDRPIAAGRTGTLWLTRQYADALLHFESDFLTQWVAPDRSGAYAARMGVAFSDMRPVHRDALWEIVKREESAIARAG
jgi:hypothetical protein